MSPLQHGSLRLYRWCSHQRRTIITATRLHHLVRGYLLRQRGTSRDGLRITCGKQFFTIRCSLRRRRLWSSHSRQLLSVHDVVTLLRGDGIPLYLRILGQYTSCNNSCSYAYFLLFHPPLVVQMVRRKCVEDSAAHQASCVRLL